MWKLLACLPNHAYRM